MRKRALPISLFTIVSSILLLLPYPALANHGVAALGGLVEFMLIVLGIYYVILLIVTLLNLRFKKNWLRSVSIILTMPLFVLAVMALFSYPPAGLVGLVLVLLIGLIIYGSYEQKPVSQTNP